MSRHRAGSVLAAIVDRARSSADDVLMLARLTYDLPAFLRRPVTLEAARAQLQRHLATRPERLLTVVERLIYGHPRSPYLALLRNVGCELGDFRALVARAGPEAALRQLAAQGVYVTFDEFKGRSEAVRGSQRFAFHERDFDNPALVSHFKVQTGGSRGRPSIVGRSLVATTERAALRRVALAAHGLVDPRVVFWLTGPVSQMLTYGKLGLRVDAWFHPLRPLPIEVRSGARYLRAVARLARFHVPKPIYLGLEQPERLAQWLAARTHSGRHFLVFAPTSSAVRAAVAAHRLGIDLSHVTFHAQSEPMTAARRAHLEATGAGVLVTFGSIETSSMGHGCPRPATPDDVHLFADSFVAITHSREVMPGGPRVDALLVTSLTTLASKIHFNAETGDYATIEQRDCGCLMGQIGLTTHLSEIRSFEKLTGEGMTVVRTSLVQVIEEVLPARFGGSSLDYQLVEEEAADSTTRLALRIHPWVGEVDDAAVRATLHEELRRISTLDAHMAETWRRAGTVAISRVPPLATGAGKILPFHLARASAGD